STAAFNALLKTLEEPPAHVKFMFATTDPEKVLPTILSRCQRFDLRRIPAALISKHLEHIAKLEKVNIDSAALHAIARGAEGAMRDAESTLDQLISFCGDKIEEPDVLSMFGLTAQGQLLDLARCVLAGEVEKVLRQLNDLANNGKDLGRLLSDLLNHFRNLLIFQVSRGDLAMLEVSEAEGASLSEQSKMAGAEGLTRIMEVLGDAEMRLRDAASKKILVEVALLKAIEARNAMSIDALLKRLHGLQQGSGVDAPVAAQPVPAARPAGKSIRAEDAGSAPIRAERELAITAQPASPSAPIENGAPETVIGSSEASGDLQALWARLIEAVGRVSQFTRSYLLEAHPVSFNKNVFVIGFDPQFEDHLGLVDNARNHAVLQTKLQELGHPNAQFKFVKAEAPVRAAAPQPEQIPAVSPSAPKAPVTIATARAAAPLPTPVLLKEKPASVPFNKDDFKNDPLIAKALEIFKGQIVEVRS
ncbi:MAG: polymerase subunit gamma/tau, partial [Verrucomicrobiota bacterium]